MSTIHSTKDTFKKDVLDYKGIVLVDFYAEWCGPCQMTGPIIDDLALSSEYKKKVRFVKINVDQNQELASQYNVMSIPTFIIFKDGKETHQFVGGRDKSGFENELKRYI
jgi:thioredoxin 1